ncbi:putative plus-end-directed kinesin ATPase [Helianthus anomalus]
MQLKKLKLRKDNLTSESYRFDEVFTESASQKRVYEEVAKPVVEVSGNRLTFAYFMFGNFSTIANSFLHYCELISAGLLNGYNGMIMAYGQTGIGKTYTLGKLVKDDDSVIALF